MGILIESRPPRDPERWARIHLQGDREKPFFRRTGYSLPFWRPEWEIRDTTRH
jgi:hypothetical protein